VMRSIAIRSVILRKRSDRRTPMRRGEIALLRGVEGCVVGNGPQDDATRSS
jgi:hypothetical protein